MVLYSIARYFLITFIIVCVIDCLHSHSAFADSVNSPNITLNVDTNRLEGAGAGNVPVSVNTITIAETMLSEYSSGTGKSISLTARPGFRFVAGTVISARSATIGLNGGAVNAVATRTATGAADEVITFNLTSGTNTTVQDIIRINDVRVIIGSAAGAAGPAQNTLSLTTSTTGGGFTNQGIVAASITKGAPFALAFAAQPSTTQAAADLLPSVKIVDFGGNVITNDNRAISLALEDNPGAATLAGTVTRNTVNGVATWTGADNLAISTAAAGYSITASHDGADFLSSDTVESAAFEITAGDPGGIEFLSQPVDTSVGGDILVQVRVVDEFGNLVTNSPVDVSLDSISSTTSWPLLVDTSLTKTTSNGIAEWAASDHLRINKTVNDYTLIASGLGATIESNPFDVIPGAVHSLNFAVQPSNTKINQAMDPVIQVEVVDSFGNRTSTSGTINLSYLGTKCKGTLSGNSATATDGLATFDDLSINKPCEGGELQATLDDGEVAGSSDAFDIKARNSVTVPVRSARLKNRLFTFNSRGSFPFTTRERDNPTRHGATLTVVGATGRVRYKLPPTGWSELSGGGFSFSGARCQSVVLTPKQISAICRGPVGTLSIPEAGPLSMVLAVGKSTAEYCGECGGTSQGNEEEIFSRTSCARPDICP